MISQNEMAQNFWENVKELLKIRGISQRTLSVDIGYAATTIEQYIYRNSCPDIYLASAIAERLQTSLAFLMQEDPDPSRIPRNDRSKEIAISLAEQIVKILK